MPTDRIIELRIRQGAYGANDIWTWAPTTTHRVWATRLDTAASELVLQERGASVSENRDYRVRWFRLLASVKMPRGVTLIDDGLTLNVIDMSEDSERTRRRWITLKTSVRGPQ